MLLDHNVSSKSLKFLHDDVMNCKTSVLSLC